MKKQDEGIRWQDILTIFVIVITLFLQFQRYIIMFWHSLKKLWIGLIGPDIQSFEIKNDKICFYYVNESEVSFMINKIVYNEIVLENIFRKIHHLFVKNEVIGTYTDFNSYKIYQSGKIVKVG